MWTKDKPLEFIHDYLCYLDEGLKTEGKGRGLSRAQKKWNGDQSRRLKHNQPLATFGSLVEKSRAMAWCQSIQDILAGPDPKAKLLQLVDSLEEVYPLRPSKKHFNGVACESIQKVA